MVDGPPLDPVGWRVVVDVDVDAAELVADELFALGALGVEEQAAGHDRVRLLAGMASAATADDAAARVGGRVEPIADDGWADAWRAWARPVQVGSVLVRPAWIGEESRELRDGVDQAVDHVVVLDPGRAFGSGSHETTRLALAVLLEQTAARARVLDVGCGSGVLGVALAVARDAHVTAIDTDAHAVEVTRANAERNDVGDRVGASSASLDDIVRDGRRFDVVVANILAITLRAIAPSVARVVAPDGVLVLSGMLQGQVSAVDAAYGAHGLTPMGLQFADDWVARWYRRR